MAVSDEGSECRGNRVNLNFRIEHRIHVLEISINVGSKDRAMFAPLGSAAVSLLLFNFPQRIMDGRKELLFQSKP
jgi:hypothetical protein